MGKVGGSIDIHVTVEKLVAFLEDWHNAERWYVGICDWKTVTEITTGNGARFSYLVRDLGIEILYETEMFDHVKN